MIFTVPVLRIGRDLQRQPPLPDPRANLVFRQFILHYTVIDLLDERRLSVCDNHALRTETLRSEEGQEPRSSTKFEDAFVGY